MAEPITILIGKGQVADGTTADQQSPQATADQQKEPGKPNFQQQAVNAALINAAKQVALSGVRMYGNITGDYATVESIGLVMSIGADVLMVAKGGWVGAIAVGTKYALNIANSGINQLHENLKWELGIQRAGGVMMGNNLFISGSRGTNG